jgi:hypothetical protein
VSGRVTAVLAAQAHRRVALVSLDSDPAQVTPWAGGPAPSPAAIPPEHGGEVPTNVQLSSPPLASARQREGTRPAKLKSPLLPLETGFGAGTEVEPEPPRPPAAPVDARKGAAPTPPRALSDAVAAWRERMLAVEPRADTDGDIDPPGPSWRDELLAWARAVASETTAPASVPELEAIAARFDLPATLYPALAFLYAAHLRGEGVAPAELARLLAHRWDEALGRGQLARLRLVERRGEKLHLAAAVTQCLDDLPPQSGTLVGTPSTVALLGPCAVASTDPLASVAERCLQAVGGAVLVAHPDADPRDLCLEARARGAAPLLRVTAEILDRVPVDEPVILVVPDEASADELGIPRLG